jgi:hypothetical protein
MRTVEHLAAGRGRSCDAVLRLDQFAAEIRASVKQGVLI